MKFYLDTEFIEDGKTIDLLSLGMVGETGLERYWVNSDADLSKASDWVKQNVIPHLLEDIGCLVSVRPKIRWKRTTSSATPPTTSTAKSANGHERCIPGRSRKRVRRERRTNLSLA